MDTREVVTFKRSEGCMGAEVAGVDLSRPLAGAQFEALREGLHKHHVLAIRGQENVYFVKSITRSYISGQE